MKNRLKELRARNKYTQTQLSEQTGISRQTISLIEREKITPSILIAIKLSRAFNEQVENVFIVDIQNL
ncbi:helix-turn-helix transcriptional regulator [Staphylococcus hominis]|uniref:helix-turn-helix transcriptional regulator n=1 Tax=Staphylococcus TaxID=1279 RepID=UPI001F0A6CCF|nr:MULTISPECIES: helix-turn-helix transcriptional regulator [Staphylococcus]MCH4535928.1 helix-turn-helix transcriptional regulator [Staphylococcus haemolyticus]MCI2928344.1 helix-turn-helix transcriptional regulator [Staphylococcus hominis]MDS3852893.1 helix-turn-helix transcriptional regulator [Staphylococcus hominis]